MCFIFLSYVCQNIFHPAKYLQNRRRDVLVMSHFNKHLDKKQKVKQNSPPLCLKNHLMISLRLFGIVRKVTVILEQ